MLKHLKYLGYIIRHKWFVLHAGILTGASPWRLLTHDLSKFRPSEWFAYVNKFYGKPRLGDIVHVCIPENGIDGMGRIVNTSLSETSTYAVRMLDDPERGWSWVENKGIPILDKIEAKYEHAHARHIHRNDHHWNYWVIPVGDGTVTALDIPDYVLRELVADWMGANRAVTGRWKLSHWYADRKGGIIMNRRSRAVVEELISRMMKRGMA